MEYSSPGRKRSTLRWYHHLADFANLLKAFIGTNYFSLAFGFRQSGLVLGLCGFFLIFVMTSHCCQLIVKIKYLIVNDYCLQYQASHSDGKYGPYTSSNRFRKSLQKHLDYPDIGRVIYGKLGAAAVTVFLVLTQFGFCVNYHIFLGNTIYGMIYGTYDSTEKPSIVNNVTLLNMDLNLSNQSQDLLLNGPSMSFNDLGNLTDLPIQEIITASPISTNNSWTPPLPLLVIAPLPLFLVFVLIRKVREMAPISVIANSAATIAYLLVLGYISSDFSVSPDVVLVRWATFPVFLGIVNSAYEAIGCILPIECSMEGNNHNYPMCLNLVMGLFSSMLCTLAVLGYLWMGDDTQQIIIQNLPTGTFTFAVQLILLVAVSLTYPLQVYPIIDIMEQWFFSSRTRYISDTFSGERAPLLRNSVKSKESTAALSEMCIPITAALPSSVKTWKRNILRIAIALSIATVAVLTRNVFAYVSAFIGALGSCPLAYVIPCVFHLKLRFHLLPMWVVIKDILFIVLGLVMMVFGVVVVVMEVVAQI